MDILDKIEDPLQMMKAFAHHAPVGLQIFDASGVSVFVNSQYVSIFGGAPAPGFSIFSDPEIKYHGNLPLIRKAFNGEAAVLPLLWERSKPLGKKVAIETQMVPIFSRDRAVLYVVFMYKDVTAELYMLEEREAALKERDDARSLMDSVLEQTRAVVYIKDLDGTYIFVNGQFGRIFNIPSQDILGKTDHELFQKDLADVFRKNDLHVQNTLSHLEFEELALHHDGRIHTYISLKFPVRDSAGKLYATCGISTDVTQYRSLESQLSQAKRMEAMGILAGGIAHDFNNILGIILLETDTMLLKGSAKKSDWQASIRAIKDAAQSAANLTRQLLAFGSRQMSTPRNIDLAVAVRSAKKIIKLALGSDIRMEIIADPDLWTVHIDPSQVGQILNNLCFNARDAMPKGGLLKINLRNVKKGGAEFVLLEVSDNGTGIDPRNIEQIFEPFFSTKTGGSQVGLGLATVYGIVQSVGGTITVESEVGSGSTFRILLPRAKGVPYHEAKGDPVGNDYYRGTETILLVDDRKLLREATAELLREAGYTVVEAGSGKGALTIWKKRGKSIDLVLADVVMPVMSGIEMIEKIKKISGRRRLKTLFVSAYSEKKLSDYNFKQDTVHFLEKPYSAEEILGKLREVLDD